MIEMAFEYTLSVIDYTYLLFFYLKLINKKWVWKKAVPAILGIAVVQYVKDSYFDFGSMSLLADCVLVVFFLFIYSKIYSLNNFLYALMIYCVFCATIIFFTSCATMSSIELSDVLVFGYKRLIYSSILKTFTIIIFILISKPLSALQNVMEDKTERLMVAILSMILIVFSYVFGNADNDLSFFWFTLITSVILILVIYLFYRYCLTLKQQADFKIIQHSINITSEYVRSLEQEHDEIRKIRHDIKNRLLALDYLIEQKNYAEAKEILNQLSNSIDTNRVSISGNVYIDAILRQKMSEFNKIEFLLDIGLTKDFKIDGNDIISLLSNIIDNACEELDRIDGREFHLVIKGNSTQLHIKEINACRFNNNLNTDKDYKSHGYGLKIIEEIVHKYNGALDFGVDKDMFHITIVLPFE